MKNTKSIRSMFAFAGSILLIASSPSFAGIGDPAGIVQVSVPATNTVISATPYARPIEAFGTVSSVAASSGNTTLTVSVDPSSAALPLFTNTNQNVDEWYVVEILDGPAIGLILNAVGGSGSTSITVQGSLPASINIESGSKFAVRKSWTLTSLFGAASLSNVFGSGNTPTSTGVQAQVQLYNISTGTLTTYYINSLSGNYNWRSSGSTDNLNHAPVGLGTGFSIVNRKANAFLFTLSGEYRTARTRLVVPAGKKILLGNPGVFDTTFTASTITETSPSRATNVPTGSHDLYQVWNAPTRSFANYRIGGTARTNRPAASAYDGSTRTNPVISKFTALLATPANTNNANVVTIAPAFTTVP